MKLNKVGAIARDWQDRNFGSRMTVQIQAIHLAEETGEVCRAVEKQALGIRPDSRGDLGEELADVILAASSLADRAGIDLEAAVAARLDRMAGLDFTVDLEAGQ